MPISSGGKIIGRVYHNGKVAGHIYRGISLVHRDQSLCTLKIADHPDILATELAEIYFTIPRPTGFFQAFRPGEGGWESWSVSGLPGGWTFDERTGAVRGTLPALTEGNEYVITYTAEDRTACRASGSVTINVAERLFCTIGLDVSDVNTDLVNGVPVSIVLPEIENPVHANDTYTYSIVGTLPRGLSFTAATRTIAGTPNRDGNVSVEYKAVSTLLPGCEATADLDFTVTTPLTCDITLDPILSWTTVRGEAFTVFFPEAENVHGNVSYALTGSVPGLTFSQADLSLTGTPTADGTYNLTLTATDSALPNCTASRSFTITVQAPPVDPVTPPPCRLVFPTAKNRAFTVGEAVSFDVAAALNANGTVTYTQRGLPPGLTLSGRRVSGNPTKAGRYTVRVTARDSTPAGCAVTVRFTITVRAADVCNIALPAITDKTITVGRSASIDLPDATGLNGRVTYAVTGVPAGMKYVSATHSIEGAATTASTYTVTVKATDSSPAACSASRTFKIKAQAVCSLSTPAISNYIVTRGSRINPIVLPAVTGAVGAVTYSLAGTLPSGLSYDPDTRAISGTARTTGAATLTYTATDSAIAGCARSRTFTLTVNNPACNVSMPAVASTSATVGVSYSQTLPRLVGASGGVTYDIIGRLPAGLAFNAATRTISGISTADVAPYTFTYRGTDSQGCEASVTVEIIIYPACSIAVTLDADVPVVDKGDVLLFTATVSGTSGNVSVSVDDPDDVLGGAVVSYFKRVAIISSAPDGVSAGAGEYTIDVIVSDDVCTRTFPVTITVASNGQSTISFGS